MAKEQNSQLNYEVLYKVLIDGRPVDFLQLSDGCLLISDDSAGVIYRLTYSFPEALIAT